MRFQLVAATVCLVVLSANLSFADQAKAAKDRFTVEFRNDIGAAVSESYSTQEEALNVARTLQRAGVKGVRLIVDLAEEGDQEEPALPELATPGLAAPEDNQRRPRGNAKEAYQEQQKLQEENQRKRSEGAESQQKRQEQMQTLYAEYMQDMHARYQKWQERQQKWQEQMQTLYAEQMQEMQVQSQKWQEQQQKWQEQMRKLYAEHMQEMQAQNQKWQEQQRKKWQEQMQKTYEQQTQKRQDLQQKQPAGQPQQPSDER